MYKDFDAMLNEKGTGRPDFMVGGQKFTARAKLPWKKFGTLILSMFGDDRTSSNGMDKTEEFFRLVLIQSDRQRFIDLLNYDGDEDEDEDNIVSSEQVSDVLDWLLEYYTGKAETTDESSLSEPSSTGLPVKPASLSVPPTPTDL